MLNHAWMALETDIDYIKASEATDQRDQIYIKILIRTYW